MIKWLEENSVVSWVVVSLIAIFIFYVSSLSFEAGTRELALKSVVYHTGVFFLFGFFVILSLVRGKRIEFIFVGFLLALLYGISDEVHQLFVPGRYGSLKDVFLDGVGIIFATMVYWIRLEAKKIQNSF